jgi:hypothetical protein
MCIKIHIRVSQHCESIWNYILEQQNLKWPALQKWSWHYLMLQRLSLPPSSWAGEMSDTLIFVLIHVVSLGLWSLVPSINLGHRSSTIPTKYRYKDCIIREANETELHPSNMKIKDGFCRNTSPIHWNNSGIFIEFEVLTAMVMKSSIFWDITPCSPLKVNCFRETCHLQLQGWRISQARDQHATVFLLVFCVSFFSPEERGDMFLQNVGWLSTDYIAL